MTGANEATAGQSSAGERVDRAIDGPASWPAWSMTFINAMLTALFVAGLPFAAARATTIDFETLVDGDAVIEQYAPEGVHVDAAGGALALVAGVSLNEFQFPPHSGETAVTDGLGPLTFDFDAPITDFAGYFTYTAPVMLRAYDRFGALVASITSRFAANFAADPNDANSHGDVGSAPNELLALAFAGGFSRVVMEGAATGGSFVLDDVTFTTAVRTVPLPGTLLLALTGLALLPRRRA